MVPNLAQTRIIAGFSRQQMAAFLRCDIEQVNRWERAEAKVPEEANQMLHDLVAARRARLTLQPPPFTFIDLFAGIGGMRLGFEAAGGKCVFTSEWNKYAQQTYKANFGEEEIAGDITKVDAADIPKHDVLVAGFPCQPFSLAGVSKKNALGRPHGFECETQGTLFFDIERIIAHHRPRAFLLENVKNLKSHDKGNTWRVIRSTLEDKLKYRVHHIVLDAKHVLPQHRERVFIVGFRDSADFSWDDLDLGDSYGTHRLGGILHPEDGSETPERHYTEGADARVSSRYTLTDHLWRYLQDYAKKHQAKGNGFGCSVFGPDDIARTLSARYYKDGSEVLIRRPDGNPRRLTPRECARLMGFDPMCQQVTGKQFVIPVSDTQAYKQFGNSVAVPLVRAVASVMAKVLAEQVRTKKKKTVREEAYA
jgi:DNA (cytosine-5)-methyltransferase 1